MKFSSLLIALIGMMALGPAQAQRSESPPLSSFPFDQPGEYEFHFRQAHRREVTLLLEVQAFEDEPGRAALTRLKTVMDASLIDHAGRTVCRAVGTPAQGVTNDGWVLRGSAGEAAFWHFNCREIKLKRSELYTLKIRIQDVDPKTPQVKLTPVFERSDDFGP